MKLPDINIKTANKRILFFVLADIILITLSVVFAFVLRFDWPLPIEYLDKGIIQNTIILSLIFSLPIFYFFGLYFFSWSFVSTSELVSLAKAVILSFVFATTSIFVLNTFAGFPRSTLVISYFLIFAFCGGIRFAKRIYLELFAGKELTKERVLIVGAGEAGEQILRSILAPQKRIYSPIGFVDDDSSKQGILIHGFKVLGKLNRIPDIVKDYQVQEMVVALPSAGAEAIKKAVELGRKSGLSKIKVVPSIAEIIDGKISIYNLREIQIDDLLQREPISLNTGLIEKFIKNKKVLITGAAGSIGSELVRQVAKFKPSLLMLLDQDETGIFNISGEIERNFPNIKINPIIADVTDEKKIKKLFSQLRPKIFFHAAAYKHVPLMEKNPEEAVKNNVFGTRIVAENALRVGAEKFIFISTDKAINPTSIMGATKRIGEMICQTLNQKNHTKFISVRFGNVLNSRGSVIPTFKEQIKRGGPVEVTHPEMKRYFMTIPEAVLLVMQAAEMGEGGEVFVLDMGKPVKIVDLAREMIKLSGFEPDKDITIVFTKPRPGEKLFEEILTAEEGTIATQNKKIFIAKLAKIEPRRLANDLEKIKNVLQEGDKKGIVGVLKEKIPFYQTHSS